jgi:hypothetical protein
MASAFVRRGSDIQAVLGGNFHRLLGSSWISQPRDVVKKS